MDGKRLRLWVRDTIMWWRQVFRLHGHIILLFIGAFIFGVIPSRYGELNGILLFLSIIGAVLLHISLENARETDTKQRSARQPNLTPPRHQRLLSQS